jgi:hypothetical protein
MVGLASVSRVFVRSATRVRAVAIWLRSAVVNRCGPRRRHAHMIDRVQQVAEVADAANVSVLSGKSHPWGGLWAGWPGALITIECWRLGN